MGINQINALKIINQKKIGNKIFTCKFNHCGKVGQKAANFQEHEAYKNERLKNWKKKEKEVRIEYENSKGLFENDLWELALHKFEEIPVPSNPPDDNKVGMGNMNLEEKKRLVRTVQVGLDDT